MNWHSISLPLIVIGVVLYHLSQKSIPQQANPFVVLSAAYLIALCISVGALFVRGDFKRGAELFRGQDWLPVIFLGLTAVAIELGYLYAYRTGWRISTTGITTGAFTTAALAIIGVWWFKEDLSMIHAVGIGFCIIGIVCINLE